MEDFNDLDGCSEIIMQDEDGNEKEYLVIDTVEDMGVNYLLVVESKSDDDETEAVIEAVILKEIEQEDEVSIYDVVEQDAEFERIALLFKNSNEDYEIEL